MYFERESYSCLRGHFNGSEIKVQVIGQLSSEMAVICSIFFLHINQSKDKASVYIVIIYTIKVRIGETFKARMIEDDF